MLFINIVLIVYKWHKSNGLTEGIKIAFVTLVCWRTI